jgi:hypothetical protein
MHTAEQGQRQHRQLLLNLHTVWRHSHSHPHHSSC